MSDIAQMELVEITVGATPKTIASFIDDTFTSRKMLERVAYVKICGYDKDGDTVRGAIDIVFKPNVSGEIKQPILAGQSEVFSNIAWGALNNIYLERAAAADVDTTLIVGFRT